MPIFGVRMQEHCWELEVFPVHTVSERSEFTPNRAIGRGHEKAASIEVETA